MSKLSAVLAVLFAIVGMTLPVLAAPLTGHTYSIRYRENQDTPWFPNVIVTADDLAPEITAANGFPFTGADFFDIGADFMRIESDGIGPPLADNPDSRFGLDIQIQILGGARFVTQPMPTNSTTFPGNFLGDGIVLTERILLLDLNWEEAGFFLVDGLQVTFASDVPTPGALALLGFGALALCARSRKAHPSSNCA